MNDSTYDQITFILQNTSDGDDLSPGDLYFLQVMANAGPTEVTEAMEVRLSELANNVKNGYKKPWLCGIENLTKDHEGFVYWKGIQVEHYSHMDYHKEKAAAEELARRCTILESKGIPVNGTNAIWKWKD